MKNLFVYSQRMDCMMMESEAVQMWRDDHPVKKAREATPPIRVLTDESMQISSFISAGWSNETSSLGTLCLLL